ncbi:MAG: DUF2249 domain-containing protein [Tepidiformaceae bacterium]
MTTPHSDHEMAVDGSLGSDNRDVMKETVDVLIKALRGLGNAGHPEDANRLAARGWSVLRESHPREAEHINGVMHYLARLPAEPTTGGSPLSTETEPVLDIRPVPHSQRHLVIFGKYLELAPGAGFVLLVDHDPVPLRYQFQAEHKDNFTWDYLEEGPQTWRVRIGRAAA